MSSFSVVFFVVKRLNPWIAKHLRKYLPWLLGIAAFAMPVLMVLLLTAWWRVIPIHWQIELGVLLFLSILLIGGLFSWSLYLVKQQTRLQQQLAEFQAKTSQTEHSLRAVFALNREFSLAENEEDVVAYLLKFAAERSGALAASLVPFDERGQPLTSMEYGELPTSLYKAWVEYLASSEVRQRCRNCRDHSSLNSTCPLMNMPLLKSVAVYCLPLRRGEREYGVLNLYLPSNHQLDDDTRAFLHTIVDETALVIEGIRLRRREYESLERLRSIRYQKDLHETLNAFLEYIKGRLKADFVFLWIHHRMVGNVPLSMRIGDLPSEVEDRVQTIVQNIDASDDSGSFRGARSEIIGESDSYVMLKAPLRLSDQTNIGVILVGVFDQRSFTRRQLSHLEATAHQITSIVQEHHQLAEMEYQMTMAERTRLAREIHDGLAQILGFLKLQVAQMSIYFEQGEVEKARQALHSVYQTLSDAYQEVRQAIDSLRIKPADSRGLGWLEQTVVEFRENTGIEVSIEGQLEHLNDTPPEVQAQLIRIVQEALSNVRKHAHAKRTWVFVQKRENDLLLEVGDDGIGFAPEDVPQSSRHGLRGMQERAELLSADLQIISQPYEGTIVRVSLPQREMEKDL